MGLFLAKTKNAVEDVAAEKEGNFLEAEAYKVYE